jgi:Peptidase family S41/N-terminal domain of Peptidase_S41 in eukaryotic IRBP
MPILLLAILTGSSAAAAQAQVSPAQTVAEPMLSSSEVRTAVIDVAQKLEQNYVFPEIAKRYSRALREQLARGDYDAPASAASLARRLTAKLQGVSPDLHVRVTVRTGGTGLAQQAASPQYPWIPIEEARWLTPHVAYIRFNFFPSDDRTVAAVRTFMIRHAAARTIVFDNRTHHGGGLAEMNAMFPFLFSKPTVLVMMDTRASVGGEDEPFVRRVAGPPDVVRREHYVVPSRTEKRLFHARVFVLTSGVTGSAAEHMTLALKRTHRALIIGEPTAGAAHYGAEVPVGDKLSLFLPVGRTFDPDTGKDWDGTGVEPDIFVPARDALTEALRRSGLTDEQARAINATVNPSGSMERHLPYGAGAPRKAL